MILTRTPLRISLAGGGSDMPSFYQKEAGAVVSFAIDKYVYVAINKKFDGRVRVSYSTTEEVDSVSGLRHDIIRETLKSLNFESGIEIVTIADVPGRGTGLGSSSATTIGLLNALSFGKKSPSQLAEAAFRIEAERCGNPVGKQDQYACAYGGINFIYFKKGQPVKVSPLSCASISSSPWNISQLESGFLLLWTGRTRNANAILQRQMENIQADPVRVRKIASHAVNLYKKMVDGISREELGKELSFGWSIKKQMAEGISDNWLDEIHHIALSNGAYGGKLLGAGGGGFFLFVANPENHERICRATGLKKVPFKIVSKGSEVVFND